MRKFLLSSLLFAALSSMSFAQANTCEMHGDSRCVDSQTISSSGNQIRINSIGTFVPSFEEIITGTPSTVTITISGCMPGGTCEVLDTYSTVANTIRNPVQSKTYKYYLVSASWTGGTSPTVQVNTVETTSRSKYPARDTMGCLDGYDHLPCVVAAMSWCGSGSASGCTNAAVATALAPVTVYTTSAQGIYRSIATAHVEAPATAGTFQVGINQWGFVNVTSFVGGTPSITSSSASSITPLGTTMQGNGRPIQVFLNVTGATGSPLLGLDVVVERVK